MRCKRILTGNMWNPHSSPRYFGTTYGTYSDMVNAARVCQKERENLINKVVNKNAASVIESVNEHLNTLITFHSLKLSNGISLTLEETTYLCKNTKSLENKCFFEQLKVLNHMRILDYCRQYQVALKDAGWNLSIPYKDPPDELILGGLNRLEHTFVLMFSEGLGGYFEMMYGSIDPEGTFYFFDRLEEHEHLKAGSKLLVNTLKLGTNDPFLNAAIIHNEFAKGHQFDKEFGLLFCRLHMNFALMLTGYSPAVIDSSQKDEYLDVVQKDKLDDPKPLATFLVRNLIATYQNHILPEFETAANNNGIPISYESGYSINTKY